jgi:hypothetical protein
MRKGIFEELFLCYQSIRKKFKYANEILFLMGLGNGGKKPETRIFPTVFMKNLGGQWSLPMKL